MLMRISAIYNTRTNTKTNDFNERVTSMDAWLNFTQYRQHYFVFLHERGRTRWQSEPRDLPSRFPISISPANLPGLLLPDRANHCNFASPIPSYPTYFLHVLGTFRVHHRYFSPTRLSH